MIEDLINFIRRIKPTEHELNGTEQDHKMLKFVMTSVLNAYRKFECFVSGLSGTNQPPRLGYFNGRKPMPVRIKSYHRNQYRR